jgi:hypothetical protein
MGIMKQNRNEHKMLLVNILESSIWNTEKEVGGEC